MIIGYLDPWGNSDRNLVCDSPTPELQPPSKKLIHKELRVFISVGCFVLLHISLVTSTTSRAFGLASRPKQLRSSPRCDLQHMPRERHHPLGEMLHVPGHLGYGAFRIQKIWMIKPIDPKPLKTRAPNSPTSPN